VAAGFAVAGLGSDTGNSIRGPASHLALFGIRSTLGLTSRDGIIPLAFDRDVGGPLTRSVADGARLFTVLAGYDPADPLTQPARLLEPVNYSQALRADGLEGLRLGVLEALVTTADADPRVTALFHQAVSDLAAAGAQIVEPVVIPTLAGHMAADYFCPRFRYDMFVYLRSFGERAPFLDVMSVRESGAYSEYVADELEYFAAYPLETPPEQWEPPCPTYPDHPGRSRFLADVVARMDELDLDLLIYPTWTNPPAAIDRAEEHYRGDNSQLIAPATGLPAATVPMGFVDDRWPAGLQLLARPYAESVIFQAAYAYEQATQHRRSPVLVVKTP
jgi:Asp-tRNA(Asn)/Glu-tRNA(Gln) amidotransferase A subunit family amidase